MPRARGVPAPQLKPAGRRARALSPGPPPWGPLVRFCCDRPHSRACCLRCSVSGFGSVLNRAGRDLHLGGPGGRAASAPNTPGERRERPQRGAVPQPARSVLPDPGACARRGLLGRGPRGRLGLYTRVLRSSGDKEGGIKPLTSTERAGGEGRKQHLEGKRKWPHLLLKMIPGKHQCAQKQYVFLKSEQLEIPGPRAPVPSLCSGEQVPRLAGRLSPGRGRRPGCDCPRPGRPCRPPARRAPSSPPAGTPPLSSPFVGGRVFNPVFSIIFT